ncbi:MAG TPA: FixH family protein [Streptosporangiaceae bacterium]|nr:FixH family protein [Streptosporangiaceae bacterium]
MARRFIYLVATFMFSALGIVAVAPAAWAHATLEAASPADGAIVSRAPAEVTATFDESVGVSADSLQVFAPNGTKVADGATTHGSSPSEIVVKLKTGLGKGTYTVGWHVISADSHPVQGAWTFSIGAPSSTIVNPNALNPTSSPVVGFAFGLTRWLAFCCFALLMGAVAFVLFCWPAGASSPLVLRLTMGAWSGLAASVLGALLLQGVYGSGEGVAKVFWPNVLHATLYSRYGRSLGIRLILVVVALFVFTAILGNLREEDRRVPVRASITWGVLTAALAATWAAADHAGQGIQVPLALVSDIIHLSSVALWLGGLTMLAAIVLRRPRTPGGKVAASAAVRKSRAATQDAIQAVERFSPIALGCVGALLLSGTYQAWRGVGTWPALVDTTYGRLLLIKIGAMLVLIGLGYVARIRIATLRAPAAKVPLRTVEWVAAGLPNVRALAGARPGHGRLGNGGSLHIGPGNGAAAHGHAANGAAFQATANGARSNGAKSNGAGTNGAGTNGAGSNGSPADASHAPVTLRRLRWSVAAEATIAVAILGVTSILVNTATARESFTRPASAAVTFNTGGPGGRGSVAVTMTPDALGPNQVRVTVTSAAGKPYQPKQISVALRLPARNLGPLAVTLDPAGPGRYVSKTATPISVAGKWQLVITIRSDAFDETSVIIPVTVN